MRGRVNDRKGAVAVPYIDEFGGGIIAHVIRVVEVVESGDELAVPIKEPTLAVTATGHNDCASFGQDADSLRLVQFLDLAHTFAGHKVDDFDRIVAKCGNIEPLQF